MNGTAGAIAAQLGELQRLHHDALSGKCRIAMQQHWQRKIYDFFAREIALENAMEYVLHSRLEGAYAEFGVWQGRTISAAWHLARERRLTTAFWAFDSFSGLPEVAGRDASGFQHFKQGEFAFGERAFRRRLKINGVEGVNIVAGRFEESLTPAVQNRVGKVAIAWIDCDLYESTVPVLRFLTPLLDEGTLLFFDDWYCYRANPDRGQQRAYHEWSASNPAIRTAPFLSIGWHGQSFVVA